MKWLTKRALLVSDAKMFSAISMVLVSFVDKLRAQGKIGLWYTSVKNDDGKPSFRVYLQVNDQDEQSILSEFEEFLNQNREEVGWTGEFHSPDPGFDPSYPHLSEINQACELILELAKKFPRGDRRTKQKFWKELEPKVNQALASMDPAHHGAFVHFLANNLVMSDFSLAQIIGIT